MTDMNNQLLLIAGYSGAGKSAGLRNIRDQEDWLYLITEAGKRLPFKNKFKKDGFRISDPYQVIEAFDHGINNASIKGIALDSLTFLMDMYESMYVLNAANTMKAWGDYGQFFKTIMQQKVVDFNRPTVIIAHNKDELDEKAMEIKTSVPMKGAIGKGQGVEAYFSSVLYAKKMPIKDIEKYQGDMLKITDEEREDGFKHVFQTRVRAQGTGERIRSPMGLFSRDQVFVDNDIQMVLDHLAKFYA